MKEIKIGKQIWAAENLSLKDKEEPQKVSQNDKYKDFWKSLGHCTGKCINDEGEECCQCGDIVGGMTLWDEKKEKDFQKVLSYVKDTLYVSSLLSSEDTEEVLNELCKIYK